MHEELLGSGRGLVSKTGSLNSGHGAGWSRGAAPPGASCNANANGTQRY